MIRDELQPMIQARVLTTRGGKMTNGFTRRKEQSKDDIRRAAWDLFHQFGVEKVSMADIARKAGVAQATIYNNFGSKEALAREFAAAAIEQLVYRAQEALAPSLPIWDKLAAFFQFISEMMAQGSSPDSITAVLSLDPFLNDPEVQVIREMAQEKMTLLLLGLVEEGIQQGQIPADIPEDALRIYFGAFMQAFAAPEFRRRYRQNPDLVQNLGSLMAFGLCVRKPD